ncbi:putative RING-H2 zinc finger domain [Lyophyllum shimeji]|uniref:RING-H2 zinc finger domain n=1 Tax=Lyophyllum shimeji TaxID=47721 RepID=A0A9P3ULN4_LYOSH|nr:putative RING-H2 zinc finger domain [Lyophyllum shimeji]
MSSREPLWFCHECHAEMRPLMVPDPACASCRGSFVERMEDPANDPRDFAHFHNADMDDGMPPGMDTFLLSLQTLIDRGIAEGREQTSRVSPEDGISGNRFTFQIRTGSSQSSIGGRSGNGGTEPIPTMSEFLRRGPAGGGRNGRGTITGPLMAQYLMALLGRDGLLGAFGDPAMEGRMGDYVFNQEALDQIITQLMENSNAHRPVPATEEIINNLPREVLEQQSPLLERDCAVCKEQFKLETEDPDEQLVITLPCKHPFHEPCIIPWLKSSGTCPVCRHALVPQPEHHPPGTTPSPGPNSRHDRSPSPSSRNGGRSSFRDNGQDTSGIFQSLFGSFVGGGHNSGSSSGRSNSNSSSAPQGRGNGHLPGGWEELD